MKMGLAIALFWISNSSVFAQKKIDSINLYVLKAIDLKKENKIEEAINTLRDMLIIKPQGFEGYKSKTKGLMLLCDYRKQSKAIENNNNFEKEVIILALSNSNNAIKLFPKVAENYFSRGQLHFEYLNQPDSALKYFSKYISLNKTNVDAYRYRLSVYNSPKYLAYDKAINDYTQLIKLDTNNIKNHYERRAICFNKVNKLDSAILDYAFLINKYQDLKYNEYRGDLYIQLKKYSLGINDYTTIIKNNMTKRDIRIKRANAYFENNSLDTTYFEYTNIKMEFDMASMNKEIATVINKKYNTKLTQIDIDKSDKFLDVAKNDILWPYQLKTAEDTKNYNQIKEALSNSIKANPYQYNAFFWMAEIEYTIANYEGAKKNYLAANEIMPLNNEFLTRANKSEAVKTK